MARLEGISRNLNAFLDMIAAAEGTKDRGDDGYNILVGGMEFSSYRDHPRMFNRKLNSTAAGRYQILMRIYDHYKYSLGFRDFMPDIQDKIAIKLIRECKAMRDVETGCLRNAIEKCKSRWASFPGAGYGQGERTYEWMEAKYLEYGGVIA